ncbi:hypothetical protein IMZ48_49725 [Candidatus Bathyarchaeota archaeon]|nr:hypothetical protein [Candidatus Bathyarchaeota archaeon]
MSSCCSQLAESTVSLRGAPLHDSEGRFFSPMETAFLRAAIPDDVLLAFGSNY